VDGAALDLEQIHGVSGERFKGGQEAPGRWLNAWRGNLAGVGEKAT